MGTRNLLVSDLDGTLLGNDAALARFAHWLGARRASFRLVYASGRRFDSIIESIEATELPEPDVIVAGVGTEVRWFAGGETLPYWHDRLARRWDARVARAALAHFDDLRPQPAEFQSELKVSYHANQLPAWQLRAIRGALTSAGLCAEVIYSSDRDLDIVPAGAGKAAAASFLAEYWQLPAERVLVSGDSGNDMAMFLGGFRGIIVANAHQDLKTLAGPNVFRSQFAFADGVLDGLRYWLDERATDMPATANISPTMPESSSGDPAAGGVYDFLSCWHMTRELRWRPYGRA